MNYGDENMQRQFSNDPEDWITRWISTDHHDSFRDGMLMEREAIARIIERECQEDGDPKQLRNLIAAIRARGTT